jgi:hypothetical protein
MRNVFATGSRPMANERLAIHFRWANDSRDHLLIHLNIPKLQPYLLVKTIDPLRIDVPALTPQAGAIASSRTASNRHSASALTNGAPPHLLRQL